MKSYLTIIICLTLTLCLQAQKITVTPASEDLGGGYHPSLNVLIPHTNEKTVEKKWISLLKDYKAKVKSGKDEITGLNFLLRSSDTLQVYSKISKNDNGVLLSVAFSRYDSYISPDNSREDHELLTKLLHDFALPLAKEGLNKKIEEASSIITSQKKERENLVKRNENLKESNTKMKEQINDNEREITDNEKKIDNLKELLDKQQSALEEIKNKTQELE